MSKKRIPLTCKDFSFRWEKKYTSVKQRMSLRFTHYQRDESCHEQCLIVCWPETLCYDTWFILKIVVHSDTVYKELRKLNPNCFIFTWLTKRKKDKRKILISLEKGCWELFLIYASTPFVFVYTHVHTHVYTYTHTLSLFVVTASHGI